MDWKISLVLVSVFLTSCAGPRFGRLHLCASSEAQPQLVCEIALVDMKAIEELKDGDALSISITGRGVFITGMSH